jgi:anti-sigma factor RsiW
MKEDAEVHPHELIAALIDGIVTPAEREAVQSHLKACRPCRALLEDLQRLSAASASEAVPPPPADLAARIRWRLQTLEAAREKTPPRTARVGWLAPFPLSAAAGLILAFVVLWALRDQVVPEREGAGVVPEAGPPAMMPAAEPPPEPEASQPDQEAQPPGAAPVQPPPLQPPPAPSRAAAPTPALAKTDDPNSERVGAGRKAESRVQDAESYAASVEEAAVSGAEQPLFAGEERKVFDAATGMIAAAPSPRSGRWLSLELPSLRVEVDEAGALSVDADRYACAVQLQPGEVAQIFRLASGPGLGALGDMAMAPEGLDPELAQRGRRVLTRTGVRGEGYQAIEYLDLPERPAPATLREIEALMLQLVRSDARERLEKACGPLRIP